MSNHLQSRGGDALPPGFSSQKQHILDLLMAAGGGEVPLAEIMICAAQYNACIHELRKRGYKILNRTETCNGVRHSWYRLESSPENLAPESTRKRSARAERVTVAPPLQPLKAAPSPQALSLFPEMPSAEVSPRRPVWHDPEMNAVKHG